MDKLNELTELKAMFCPPLEAATVAKVYYKQPNMEAAVADLLLLVEAADFNTRASSPELPSTESSDYLSSLSSDQSAVEFLSTCFPGQSGKKLHDAFEYCSEDVDRTIDHLLSEEYLYQEGLEESSTPSTSQYDLFTEKEGNLPGKKSKKKRKKSAANKHHDRDLPDVALDWANLEQWEPCHWRALETRTAYALEMFPRLGQFPIVQALCDCKGDLHQALEQLVGREPSLVTDATEIEARKLREIFPQYSMVRLLAYALYWPGVDQAVANLVNLKLQKPLQKISITSSRSKNAWKAAPFLVPSSSSSHANVWQPEKDHIPYHNAYPSVSHQPNSHSTSSYIEVREEIENLKAMRIEHFRKAAQAFRQRNSNGQSGVAAYYSSEGRELSSRIAQRQLVAARAYVSSNGVTRHRQLDLHGLTVAEAIPLVTEMVDAWYARESVRLHAGHTSKLPPFEIITGAGHHSVNGISRLKPLVVNLLRRHGWRYEVKTASVTVLGPL